MMNALLPDFVHALLLEHQANDVVFVMDNASISSVASFRKSRRMRHLSVTSDDSSSSYDDSDDDDSDDDDSDDDDSDDDDDDSSTDDELIDSIDTFLKRNSSSHHPPRHLSPPPPPSHSRPHSHHNFQNHCSSSSTRQRANAQPNCNRRSNNYRSESATRNFKPSQKSPSIPHSTSSSLRFFSGNSVPPQSCNRWESASGGNNLDCFVWSQLCLRMSRDQRLQAVTGKGNDDINSRIQHATIVPSHCR